MSSKSTQQRQKMKTENPQKYAEYQERVRIRSKLIRERRKEKWKNEPHTPELVMQYEREKELTRLRVRKHRSKGAPQEMTMNFKTVRSENKRPRDMTEKEKKEHTRKIQQEYRARQSAEKKQEIRQKDRAYRRAKRAKDRAYRRAKRAGLLKPKEEAANITMEESSTNFTQGLINVIKEEIQEIDEAISSSPFSEQHNRDTKNVECSSFVYNNEVKKRSSKSTKQKQKLKEENPKECAEFQEIQKAKVKQLKDRRKDNWKLYNPELVKKYERQKELTRLRVNKHKSMTSKTDMTKSRKPRDTTEKENEGYIKGLQQEYRAQQSEEKKQAIRESDREYQKAKCAAFKEELLEVTNITMEDVESDFTLELSNVLKQEIQEMDEAICSTPVSEQQNTETKNVKCSSLVYNNDVRKIFSRSTQQRQKMKTENPQKYAEYKERVRIRSKLIRERRKEKLKNEPYNWELIKQYEREKELTRLRLQKYRNKWAPQRMTKISETVITGFKKPRDMTKKERKEHTRKIQQEYRARQSAEKKQEIREKDRAYRKLKHAGLIKVKISTTTKQAS